MSVDKSKLPPSSAAAGPAPEKDAKQLSAEKPINEAEVMQLFEALPASFKVQLPGKDVEPKSKAEVIRDFFLSEQEFREVAGEVILKAMKKFTPEMDASAKAKLVGNDLLALINKRGAAKERLAHRVQADAKEGSHPSYATNLKAMIKAEEIFSTEAPQFNTVEFAGEKGEGFIAHRNAQGEVRVFRVVKILSEAGATSTVKKVEDISSGLFYAMKLSKKVPSTSQKKTRKKREHHFTRGAARAGAVSPTTLLIGQRILGYIQPLYTADMVVAMSSPKLSQHFTPFARQRFSSQIVEQQFDLQKKGNYNIDLKPDNVMLEENEKDKKSSSAKLVDLDDAISLTVENEQGELDLDKLQEVVDEIRGGVSVMGPGTARFIGFEDVQEFIRLKSEAGTFPKKFTQSTSAEEIQRALDFIAKYKEAVERRVIFTLGATCFTVLTNQFPYNFKPWYLSEVEEGLSLEDRPTPGSKLLGEFPVTAPNQSLVFTQSLIDLGYSEKVASTFAKMMSHNPSERPTREEVEQAFKSFKFLSQEEVDKLDGQTKANLVDEARGLRIHKQGWTIPKLRRELLALEARYKEGSVKKQDYDLDVAELQKSINLLSRLPELQKANREITDFNPYVEQYLRDLIQ